MVNFCSELPGNFIRNCKLDADFLNSVIAPWEAVTGGLLVPLFWGVIVFAVYLRYHVSAYALMAGMPVLITGAVFLPGHATVVVPLMIVSVIGVALFFLVQRSPGPVTEDRK